MIYSYDYITLVQAWFFLLAPVLLMILWTHFLKRYPKNSTPQKRLRTVTYIHLAGFVILTTFTVILPYKTEIYIYSDIEGVEINMNGRTFEIHSGKTILHTRYWGEKASIKLTQNTTTILSEKLIPGCTVINLSEKKNILIENLTYERNMPFGIELSTYGAPSPDIIIYGFDLYNIGSNYENIYGFDEFPKSSEKNFTGEISHSSYKLKIISKE